MSDGIRGLEHEWAFLEDLRDDQGKPAQDRTKRAMRKFLEVRGKNGATVQKAAESAGVSPYTIQQWRQRYAPFKEIADVLTAGSQRAQTTVVREMRMARLEHKGLVLPRNRTFPEKPGLVEFSETYLGRPSLPHHVAFSRAYEDKTNTKILFLMPTGAGKDTKAGDAILHAKCDDRGLMRTAFILENENFAKRRLGRLERYLTDHLLYDVEPAETEGASKPTANLIHDFGPFKWEKGMVWDDGEEVARTRWNSNELVFVGAEANEAEPDIWATGVGGDLYGTRLRLVVLSDIFTQKNQANPVLRENQMAWLRSTFKTRLDGRGRVMVLGTMLVEENNYEVLAEEWGANAGIVYSDEYYTKYRNGFAIVRFPAILNEGTDRERSFWEERFPYRTQLVIYNERGAIDQRVDAASLTDEEYVEHSDAGWEKVEGLVEARGMPGTKQFIEFQATRQQIREEDSEAVDFTDDILNMADDPNRSWGMVYPHEIAVQGVDPASVYGAGVMTVAVDRQAQTITPVAEFFDTNLGIEGIKQKLIMQPALTWMPLWLVYEINKHEGVLEDSEVRKTLRQMGVNVHPHKTSPHNRNSLDMGPASLVALMRARIWRWPMMTAEDREKTARVKAHFKAWDRHQGEHQRKTRPGQAGHKPDDLCMASWMAAVKAVPVLEQGNRQKRRPRQAVPPSVLRRLEKYQQSRNEREGLREADRVWHDGQDLQKLITVVASKEP